MFKRKICYTEITDLSQFTINVTKSHCHPQRTSHLVCEDHVLFVRVGLHISLCSQQHPKCERALRLLYPPLFCKLRCTSSPTHTKFQRIRTLDSRSSISIIIHYQIHIDMNFYFLHSDRYCLLPKYWPFLMDHSVYITTELWMATFFT
jgi:hypothetical protein